MFSGLSGFGWACQVHHTEIDRHVATTRNLDMGGLEIEIVRVIEIFEAFSHSARIVDVLFLPACSSAKSTEPSVA